MGNWQQPGGLASIEAARTVAEASLPVDASRVALVGLSNGRRGITRLIAQDGSRRWPLVVALSAVIEEELLTDAWAGREALLLHGVEDERIPIAYFDGFATELARHHAHVERRTWPGEDHFLWFARPEEVQAVVLPWLAARWRKRVPESRSSARTSSSPWQCRPQAEPRSSSPTGWPRAASARGSRCMTRGRC